MSNKQKNVFSLVGLLVVALGALVLALTSPLRLGLDLKGGMNVVLTAKEVRGAKVTEDAIAQAKLIVEERVNGLGVTEPLIERQIGTPNIIVQLPGIKDPKKTLEIIGKTALLEFKPVISSEKGQYQLGLTEMTGKAIKRARVDFDDLGQPKVDLEFTPEGATQFDKVTSQLVGKQLAIVLDGKVMSAPEVKQRIPGGRAEITGKFSLDEAKNLVLVLNTGALPVKLEVAEQRTIGPTLGLDSLRAGLRAGIIGIILVIIFLLFSYRGLALIAISALTMFAIIFSGILMLIKATITLPGIAGIILTIGFAADSSIVFFERFREEIRKGKSPRFAATQGFSFAFRTIIDADAVSLIIAATLIALSYLYFGAGPVRGFALTLTIGIITDVFTAFFFTRPALILLSEVGLFQNPIFIGVRSTT